MEPLTKRRLLDLLKGAQKIAVIGAGNVLRGDDSIGILVAYRLKYYNPPNLIVFIGETYPESFLNPIVENEEITHVIYVDGVQAGVNVGEALILEPDDLLSGLMETHKMPIKFFKDYLVAYSKNLIIIGIQVRDISIGSKISQEVFASGMRVADIINEVLIELHGSGEGDKLR